MTARHLFWHKFRDPFAHHARFPLDPLSRSGSQSGLPSHRRAPGGSRRPARPEIVTGILLCCIAPMFWGGNFVMGRMLRTDLPAEWINLLRWCIAAVVLLPFCAGEVVRHARAIRRSAGP